MTLREANYEVERMNNELNRLLKEKEILESSVQPQAVDTTKIIVDGGKRKDRMTNYVYDKELKDLDNKICIIQDKIMNYMNWIDNELKILNKYKKIEKLIVYYKEIELTNYTWYQIGAKVNYSKEQCQRIYRRYKQARYIEQDDTL